MATTPNYGLTKPAATDNYNIDVFNGNADIVDTQMKSNADLITTHTSDTNNPHHTTPEQIGAVQGNTASWVATAVVSSDAWTQNLTVPNFEFSEGCQVTFKAVQTPKDDSTPDATRITINGGKGYCFLDTKRGTLPSDAWVVGATVTVTLSNDTPPGWGASNGCGSAFFKSGSGSLKEPFTFPLSIQTAEPTPVNTNHIWIKNDTKMPFAIDEAIHVSDWGGDNRYYGIVDSTDTNYMQFEGPKKLTDGSAIGMTNRHIGKDATSWVLGIGTFGKKYGINYYANNQSKWPRIYSRINGTIDMEDAYRWDGSAWYPLSQKGSYLFGYNSSDYSSALFNNAHGILSNHSAISSNNYQIYGAEFSRDGRFLAVVDSENGNIKLFTITGDSFVQSTVTSNNASIKYWVCFTPDSQYMLAGGSVASSEIFKRNGNSFSFLKTFENAGIATDTYISYDDSDNTHRKCDIGFTSDGKFFIFKSGNNVLIYNWSNESFSLKQNISGIFDTYQSLNNLQICEDADMFMTTPHRNNDSDESAKWGVAIYESVNGGNFNRIVDYESYRDNDAGTESRSFAISPSGKYYATSRYSNGYDPPGFGLTIYQRQPDNTYTKIQNIFNGAYLVFTKFMSDNYFFTTSGGKDVHVFKFDGSQFVQTTYFDQDESIYRLTSLNFN